MNDGSMRFKYKEHVSIPPASALAEEEPKASSKSRAIAGLGEKTQLV
jgi:hypothetical protein